MTLEIPTRRGFVGGLLGLIAAPAIVRASSLMQIRGEPLILTSPLPLIGEQTSQFMVTELQMSSLLDSMSQFRAKLVEVTGVDRAMLQPVKRVDIFDSMSFTHVMKRGTVSSHGCHGDYRRTQLIDAPRREVTVEGSCELLGMLRAGDVVTVDNLPGGETRYTIPRSAGGRRET